MSTVRRGRARPARVSLGRALAVVWVAGVVQLAPGLARAQAPDSTGAAGQPLGRGGRYVRDVGWSIALGLLAGGVDHLRNVPEEWGRGWRGYERRAASDAGAGLVGTTVEHALAAVLDRPTQYTTCRCTGVGPRLQHAFLGAVSDSVTPHGRAVAVPRIAAALTGALAQQFWLPNRTTRDRIGATITAGSLSIVYGVLTNGARELLAARRH